MAAAELKPQPRRGGGYQLVGRDENDEIPSLGNAALLEAPPRTFSKRIVAAAVLACLFVGFCIKFVADMWFSFAVPGVGQTSTVSDQCPCSPSDVPQWFQTTPQLWPGPTATGRPAFMAQTVTINPTATYMPNSPLQTAITVDGMKSTDKSIFHMMG